MEYFSFKSLFFLIFLYLHPLSWCIVGGVFGIPKSTENTNDDEDLVHKICIQANNPVRCEEIVKGWRIRNPDFVNLSETAINYAGNRGSSNRYLIVNVLDDATDPIVHRQLLICARSYDMVIEDYSKCDEAFARREFVDIYNYAIIARDNEAFCHESFASSGALEPRDLKFYSLIFQELNDVVRVIAKTAAGIKL